MKEDSKGTLFFINDENQFVSSDSRNLEYSSPQASPFEVSFS